MRGDWQLRETILDPNDGRPANRRIFDVRKYAAFLEDISSLVSLKTLREAMGVSRSELTALITDGVLTPVSRVAEVRLPWRLSDGHDLVAKVQAMAVTLEETETGWETILSARNRSGLGIDQLIAAMHAGRLRLGRHPGPTDFSSLMFHKADIKGMAKKAPPIPIQAPSCYQLPTLAERSDFGKHTGWRLFFW